MLKFESTGCEYTDHILKMVKSGAINPVTAVNDLLSTMSIDAIKEFIDEYGYYYVDEDGERIDE